MTIKEILDVVEENIQDFIFTHPTSYFVHIFHMAGTDEWQVGYYDEDNIHVFSYDDKLKTVVQNPADEAFKEPGKKILELRKEDIKVEYEDALDTAEKEVTEKHKDSAIKKFVVVQNLPDLGAVYNFTFITQSYKTVNIKVSADSNKVLSSNVYSIFDLARK